MPRNITVTFEDGTGHRYEEIPDTVTPDMVEARANKDFPGKKIKNIDGGSKPSEIDQVKKNAGLDPKDPKNIEKYKQLVKKAKATVQGRILAEYDLVYFDKVFVDKTGTVKGLVQGKYMNQRPESFWRYFVWKPNAETLYEKNIVNNEFQIPSDAVYIDTPETTQKPVTKK
jgi:hypothetical protein